jgi:prevent-host-death family protein
MTRRKKSRTKAQSAPSGQVDIRQARTQLSRLIERATDGEEIIITKSGKPVARLVPYTPKGAVRRPGTMRGKIRIKKNFDEPLPKELLVSFGDGLAPIIV